MKKRPIKLIDLFAGIGGIRLGFEQAGKGRCKTVFTSEYDSAAVKTYSANFIDDFPVLGDITKIPEESIPSFDICLAGFPCQAFSIAGLKQGFQDNYKGVSRGTLFHEVVRICDYHKPKVIFCENVVGLVQHDHGNTLRVIKGAFEEIGYTVFYDVLNAKDFGLAQNRPRIYIVCIRKDLGIESFTFPKGNKKTAVIRDVLEDAPIPSKYYLSETYLTTLENHKARHKALGHGFGYQIRSLDGLANTIVVGGMGRERNLIVDDRPHSLIPITRIKGEINKHGIRRMTPREWARLQGFPESFRFVVGDAPLYKQFGNSVSVPVIKAIAEKVIKEVF